MRTDVPEHLPLICPACRKRTEDGGWDMYSLRVLTILRAEGDEVLDGMLSCLRPGCERRYPVIDGIPVVVGNLGALLRDGTLALVEGELPAEIAALLAATGPGDDEHARLLDRVSVYTDAHWGDRASPPPDGPAPAFGMAQIAERLAALAEGRVLRVVELGCSTGRGVAHLSRGAVVTVGLDLHFGVLRRARRMLRGAQVRYLRRVVGQHYAPVSAHAGDLYTPEAILICGDALDPPLCPGFFDRVVALNLLDSIHQPRRLLSVVDGLCAPGGEVVLCAPYSWQAGVVAEDERLGGADPAAFVRRLLEQGEGLGAGYTVADEAELDWWLRRDARSASAYRVHFLRAHKGVSPSPSIPDPASPG